MATKAQVIARARLRARIHDSRRDFGLDTDWEAGLDAAWRRFWAVHPDAFTLDDGTRPGSLPALPPDGPLPLGSGWEHPLVALCAAGMLRDLAGATEAEEGLAARLEAEALSGARAHSGLPSGRR